MSVPQIVAYDDRYEAQVLALAREMHAESVSHKDMPLDEAKLLQQLRASHSMPDTVYFKLCVRGNDVLGGFFGQITSVYFGAAKAAKDLAWFVQRTHRGSVAALLLVADFEAWGMSHGVKDFFLGQSTGVKIEATRALYEHLGYEVVGVNTRKRVQ
jgi:hypothetical protein